MLRGWVVILVSFGYIGLLFAITHTLFQLGYVIHLARISTNADQAQATNVTAIYEGDMAAVGI